MYHVVEYACIMLLNMHVSPMEEIKKDTTNIQL